MIMGQLLLEFREGNIDLVRLGAFENLYPH
jgi:hypothetical protein